MAFFATIISTLIKMAVIAAAAFVGILAGRKLRSRKEQKEQSAAEE